MPEVTPKRLAELERKERAHDAYLEATRFIRGVLHSRLQDPNLSADYKLGYGDALEDLAQAIVDSGRPPLPLRRKPRSIDPG